MKTKVFLAVGFFFLSAAMLFSQQNLSLNDAIKIALENNYDIKLAKSDAEINSNNFSLGNAGFLPRVDVTGTQTRTVTKTKQEYSDGSSVDENEASSNSTYANIALNWTFFDGFGMFTSYSKLREYKELGEIRLRSQVENSLSDVIQTYYDLVRQKYLYRVAKESITISEERVKLAEEKLSVGSASQLDVLRAKVDLNSDKSNLLAQEVIISSLKVSLNKLLSRDVARDFDVDDSIEIKTGLSFDQLKEAALKNNTEILQSEKNRNLSSYNVGLSKTDYYPTISLTSGYTYQKSQSDANLVKSNRSYGYNYGLNLSWNLFNGFTTQLQLENALISLDKSEIELQQSKSLLESDLLIAYKNYEKNLEILKLEDENVSVAKENLDLAIDQLNLGSLSPLEFRDVQKNYTTAQSRLASARFTAKMSEKDLLKLSGMLLSK
ncbi:MAG: TolC family protein [Ignavibacteriales bacterium]|nr:TolC family protein [Ignavibacteriales bacterium]